MTDDNGWDNTWEKVFQKRAWGSYPSESVIRTTMRTLGRHEDRSAARVLDLGCGMGANTWFLAREGFSVSCIDGSPTAIEVGTKRLAAEGLEAEWVIGDFTDTLPWDDGSFDLVIDCASLTSNRIAHIKRALAELRRVMKPGGVLHSEMFSDRTWGYGDGVPGEDPGSVTMVGDGPLGGLGYMQFFDEALIRSLFVDWISLSLERKSYTLEEGSKTVELWVAVARR